MSGTRASILRNLARPRLPSLDLALLTQTGLRYARARLSFVYLRAVLRTAVHAAELWFLVRAFPLEFAVPLLSMRAAFGVCSSLWWGPLEALRRRVRDHVGERRPDRARAAVESWVCIAVGAGLSVLAYGVFTVWRADQLAWLFDGLYGSYLLVSALALLLDLWSRTVHAGAFALGRVYRSRASMLVPDLLELALIIGLFRYLGPFALGASLLITSLLRTGLTVFYTRHAYRARRLPWPRALRVRSLASLSPRDLRDAARGLLGSVPNQLDRVLLIALLSSASSRQALPIAAPYYALRPIAGVAQGWARTYYVDLVRMDSLAATLFRARLERLLRRTSLLAGGLASASLVAGAALVFGVRGVEAAAWLVPLTLLRSHFAVLQIRAIAYARTHALAALSAVMGAAVLTAFVVQAHDRALLAMVTALLALAGLGATYLEHRTRRRPAPRAHRVPLGAWLAELCERQGPVRLHVACVDPRLGRPSAVLHQLASAAASRRTTRAGRRWIVWWEDGRAPATARALATLLGGTCPRHVHCDAPSGWEALERASRMGLLPPELGAALCRAAPADSARELRERFTRELPDGFVIDAEHASPGLATLPPAELGLIRRALIEEAHERRTVPRRARFQVAVYAPRGEPASAFVWPAHAPRAGAFRRSVVHAGWRDSLPRALGSGAR